MGLFANRSKLVTFRLTTEEYEALKSLCMCRGVRSISELTRAAVLQQLGTERVSRDAFSGDLLSLLSSLEQIDYSLRDLSHRISKVLGPADRGANAGAA